MPNTLKGIKVKGQQYHFDHEYLDNNPIPTHSTNADDLVLIAHGCSLEWASINNVLGSSSASAGDVLVATEQGIAWTSVSGLPTYDTTYPSDDGGKVLTVSDCGGLIWQEPELSLPDIPTSQTQNSDYLFVYEEDSDDPSWVEIGTSITSISSDQDHLAADSYEDFVLGIANGEAVWRPLWSSDFDSTRLIPTDASYDGMALIYENGVPTWSYGPWLDMLPSYGQSDNGKVLTVVNGELEWVMPS